MKTQKSYLGDGVYVEYDVKVSFVFEQTVIEERLYSGALSSITSFLHNPERGHTWKNARKINEDTWRICFTANNEECVFDIQDKDVIQIKYSINHNGNKHLLSIKQLRNK